MNPAAIDDLIRKLPKAELHVHIEGTLEPELMMRMARRNDMILPYASTAEIREAYQFKDLQSFLQLYYAGASVLRTETDFYELTQAYFKRAYENNVVHAEIFFDPQTHLAHGVSFETMLYGMIRAQSDAMLKYGITSRRIMCFLRDLSEAEAMATLEHAMPHLEMIHGVGLDSAENGNPPAKFERLFQRCRNLDLPVVAHAGEEGPPAYIVEALDLLGARRIDHGVRCVEDPALVHRLAHDKVPLTVCPLSNLKLGGVKRLEDHKLKELLHAGLCITVNSDDPAYFGGYLNDNLLACRQALDLSDDDVVQLVLNSFEASWLRDADKTRWQGEVAKIAMQWEEEQGVVLQ